MNDQVATYLNDNYNRFQTSERSFKNDKGEEIHYKQLQVVVGVGDRERIYDIKASNTESQVLLRADARNAEKKLLD